MKVFGMCINKKAVAGLVIVGSAIWWLAPGVAAEAWPVLLLAICPLSMLLMMKSMNTMGQGNHQVEPPSPAESTGSAGVRPATVAGGSSGDANDTPRSAAPVIRTDPRARWN